MSTADFICLPEAMIYIPIVPAYDILLECSNMFCNKTRKVLARNWRRMTREFIMMCLDCVMTALLSWPQFTRIFHPNFYLYSCFLRCRILDCCWILVGRRLWNINYMCFN